MKCPKCGSVNITVSDTMHGSSSDIFRRRRCLDCRYKFRTVEIVAEDTEEFRKEYREAVLNKSNCLLRKEREKEHG